MENEKNICELIKESIKPEVIKAQNGTQFLVHPDQSSVVDLTGMEEKYLTRPSLRKGDVTLARLKSFVDYTNKYKDDDTIIYVSGSVDKNQVSANAVTVFNDHPYKENKGDAGRRDFSCKYKFPISKELSSFIKYNSVKMTQLEFSIFLEDHAVSMIDPYTDQELIPKGTEIALSGKGADPIKMIELSRGLEIRVQEKVQNSSRASSGEMQFRFSVEHEGADGSPLTVPSWFMISIPVFEGGERVPIIAKLRYRVKDGEISWFYELFGMNDVFDMAFNNAVNYISESTGIDTFIVA